MYIYTCTYCTHVHTYTHVSWYTNYSMYICRSIIHYFLGLVQEVVVSQIVARLRILTALVLLVALVTAILLLVIVVVLRINQNVIMNKLLKTLDYNGWCKFITLLSMFLFLIIK